MVQYKHPWCSLLHRSFWSVSKTPTYCEFWLLGENCSPEVRRAQLLWGMVYFRNINIQSIFFPQMYLEKLKEAWTPRSSSYGDTHWNKHHKLMQYSFIFRKHRYAKLKITVISQHKKNVHYNSNLVLSVLVKQTNKNLYRNVHSSFRTLRMLLL